MLSTCGCCSRRGPGSWLGGTQQADDFAGAALDGAARNGLMDRIRLCSALASDHLDVVSCRQARRRRRRWPMINQSRTGHAKKHTPALSKRVLSIFEARTARFSAMRDYDGPHAAMLEPPRSVLRKDRRLGMAHHASRVTYLPATKRILLKLVSLFRRICMIPGRPRCVARHFKPICWPPTNLLVVPRSQVFGRPLADGKHIVTMLRMRARACGACATPSACSSSSGFERRREG